MPRPLQLVAEDAAGRLTLCQAGIDALSRLDQPLAAPCVTGTARSGKSFLVNQLLGQTRFVTSDYIEKCTERSIGDMIDIGTCLLVLAF